MNIEFIKPKIFPQNIKAFVTKRNVSKANELGLSFSKSDFLTNKDLEENRRKLAHELKIEYQKLKFQKQVHGNNIQIINANTEINESDAMITKQQRIAIAISIADCAAILIYDPTQKVIAGIHSGWRGTKENITEKVIEKLKNEFNSNPKSLFCYMSPCASGDSYEVGEDVARFFPNSIRKISNEKYLFDNKNEIKNQLISSGVESQNIEISNICTIGNKNYHSYRRDKNLSGRMAAIIMMEI